MPNTIQGDRRNPGGRFAIVAGRYNEAVTSRLVDGAVATLLEHGIPDENIDIAWVPGAFEIPVVADRLAARGAYQAILCLGAVIRGETTHDQHINRAVSLELMHLATRYGIPLTFGVLTCNSVEQALQRAGGRVGNKGVECALAALETAALLRQLPRICSTDVE